MSSSRLSTSISLLSPFLLLLQTRKTSVLVARNSTGNPWSVQAETVIVGVYENISILFLKLHPTSTTSFLPLS